jgi:hypothetical protein
VFSMRIITRANSFAHDVALPVVHREWGGGDWPGRAGPGRSWGSGPGSAEMKGGPGGAERFALNWVAGPIALPGPAWRQHAVSSPARPGP